MTFGAEEAAAVKQYAEEVAAELAVVGEAVNGAYDSLKNADGHVAVVTSKVLHRLYKCW